MADHGIAYPPGPTSTALTAFRWRGTVRSLTRLPGTAAACGMPGRGHGRLGRGHGRLGARLIAAKAISGHD